MYLASPLFPLMSFFNGFPISLAPQPPDERLTSKLVKHNARWRWQSRREPGLLSTAPARDDLARLPVLKQNIF